MRTTEETPTGKFLAIDGLATSTIVSGEITTLKHELRDHTVKTRTGIAEAVLASRELPKVPRGSRDDLVVQPENNATSVLAADRDVELQGKNQRKGGRGELSRTPAGRIHRRNRTYVYVGHGCLALDNRDQETVDRTTLRTRGI
jgi:hypothetical protein